MQREPDKSINLPVNADRDEVLNEFKQERTRQKAEAVIDEVMDIAIKTACPKGLYRKSYIGDWDENGIEIDGVRFNSKVLSKCLRKLAFVIPHMTTCGREIEEIQIPGRDFMWKYCLDIIKMKIMLHASEWFLDFLRKEFSIPRTIHLHPGEFADWPITEQTKMFRLFDGPEKMIGVKLTSTMTLQPIKSGTGILFPADHSFESCQLCVQENCAGRRAAYDPGLVEELAR